LPRARSGHRAPTERLVRANARDVVPARAHETVAARRWIELASPVLVELSAAVLCEVVSAVELIAGSLPLVSAVVVGLDDVEPSSALTDAASSEQPCIASTRIHRLREVILPAMVSVPGIRAVGARDRANALPHSGAASQRVSRPLWLRFE